MGIVRAVEYFQQELPCVLHGGYVVRIDLSGVRPNNIGEPCHILVPIAVRKVCRQNVSRNQIRQIPDSCELPLGDNDIEEVAGSRAWIPHPPLVVLSNLIVRIGNEAKANVRECVDNEC